MDVSLQEIALINLEKDVAIRRLEQQLAHLMAMNAASNGKVPDEEVPVGDTG